MYIRTFNLLVILFILGIASLYPNHSVAYPITPYDADDWYCDDGKHGHGYSEPFMYVPAKDLEIYFSNVADNKRGIDIVTEDGTPPDGCPTSKVEIIFKDGKKISLHKSFHSCDWLYGESDNRFSLNKIHRPDEEHYVYDKIVIGGIPPVAIRYDNHYKRISQTRYETSIKMFEKITDPKNHPELYDQKKFTDTDSIIDDVSNE